MKVIFSSQFKNELGVLSSILESDTAYSINISKTNKLKYTIINIQTEAYSVYLFEFKINNCWLPKEMKIEDSLGWLWNIEKKNDIQEKLRITCSLINPSSNLSSEIDDGEWLDAIRITNTSKVMHIGTEDCESFFSRCKSSDCMPNRFIDFFDDGLNCYTFHNFMQYGFKTQVPDLYPGEKICFQYLSAIDKKEIIVNSKIENNLSTWFAVEQTRSFLVNKLNINNHN